MKSHPKQHGTGKNCPLTQQLGAPLEVLLLHLSIWKCSNSDISVSSISDVKESQLDFSPDFD